ncbi:hypothetical protein ROZALSC1DRAFT_26129 [Rozella allomycis CSF55]|uniref:ZW10 C-terminal helical domain-containing protein n=1 Tax=Rozella allomycis (strain CSF55) TaxID=988480 RepID=A0A4P9Y984_ROZAC|nr:hypothetical protein ROZALSC1DRAFT_26129 [Rozella allomycis CSF55]
MLEKENDISEDDCNSTKILLDKFTLELNRDVKELDIKILSLQKLECLSNIFGASLQEILNEFSEGNYQGILNNDELEFWIKALFADTARRKSVLNQINNII